MWEKIKSVWKATSRNAKLVYAFALTAFSFLLWVLLTRWFGASKPQPQSPFVPKEESKTLEQMGDVIREREREKEAAERERLETQTRVFELKQLRHEGFDELFRKGTEEQLNQALKDEVEK